MALNTFTNIYTGGQLAAGAPSYRKIPVGDSVGITFRNYSPYWFIATDDLSNPNPLVYIEPWSQTDHPLKDIDILYIVEQPQMGTVTTTVPTLNNNQSLSYLCAYSGAVLPKVSRYLQSIQMVQTDSNGNLIPFNGDVNITNSNINATVQSGTIDANITNSTVPMTLTATDITMPISGSVNINAGQTIGISGNVPVTASDSSGLPVTTGSGGLSVTVNNTVDMSITSSTVTLPVSVGDATLNTSITSSTVTLDNNITNASITTNMGYANSGTISVVSGSGVANIPIVPGTENEVYDVLGGKFFLASPGGNLYNVTIMAMQLSTNNFFSMDTNVNDLTSIGTGNTDTFGAAVPFYFSQPQPCNALQFSLSAVAGTGITETVTIHQFIDGNAVRSPNISLGDDFYSFLQAPIGSGGSNYGVSLIGSAPGDAPLPTQLYTLDTSTSPYESLPISNANPLPVAVVNTPTVDIGNTPTVTLNPNGHSLFTSVSTVSGGATVTPDSGITMSKIYGVWFSAGGNAGGVTRVVLSSGPWIAQVQTPNNNQWSVSNFHSEQAPMGVSTGYIQIVQLYGTTTDTVYYDLKVEYDP
jgi:hypothetical protein